MTNKNLPPNNHLAKTTKQKCVVTDHYVMGDLLGEGGYGTVHMARRKPPPASKREKSSGGGGGGGRYTAAYNSAGGGTVVEAAFGGPADKPKAAAGLKAGRSGDGGVLGGLGGGGVGGQVENAGSSSGVAPGTCVAIKKVSSTVLVVELFIRVPLLPVCRCAEISGCVANK